MSRNASRAPDGSIHLILPDGEYAMERNGDTYGEIGDESGLVGRFSNDPSPSELRELSKSRIACCCCHIKVCAAMVLLFSLMGFALKYLLASHDYELEYTLQLLTLDWYDASHIRIAILVTQLVSVIGLALSISTDCRYFAIPFMIMQSILTLAQAAVVAIYLFRTAMFNLGSHKLPAEHFIRFIFKPLNNVGFNTDIGERIISNGDPVVAFVVVAIALPILLINFYFWETAEQLFRYLRLKSIYGRLRD